MAKFRKLSAEELAKMRAPVTGERARIREEYRGYLEKLEEGAGAEFQLEEGENKTTIKNRLKRAARDLNMEVRFQRSARDVVILQVLSAARPSSDG